MNRYLPDLDLDDVRRYGRRALKSVQQFAPPARRSTPPSYASLAVAAGFFAIGAFAVGALAIGSLAIGRARIGKLEVDELVVRKLTIIEKRSDS